MRRASAGRLSAFEWHSLPALRAASCRLLLPKLLTRGLLILRNDLVGDHIHDWMLLRLGFSAARGKQCER
jgi:hypothetical protein